jgi:hypothetical protein
VGVVSIVGRTYLERGKPVRLINGFALPSKSNPLPACPPWLLWSSQPSGPPRNVAILRESGDTDVRPFRGLRKLPTNPTEETR